MKNKIIVLFSGILLFFSFSSAFAQYSRVADSLLNLLQSPSSEPDDTSRINNLNLLAWDLKRSNPDTAILLAKQALELSLNLFKGKKVPASYGNAKERHTAKSYNNLGVINRAKGNFPIALDYYFKSLKIREQMGDKKAISVTLSNIGVVYSEQRDYTKASTYYLRSLKLAEELNDTRGISICIGNLGILYDELGDYQQALSYDLRALKIAEGEGDKNGIARNLGNIGNVYSNLAKQAKQAKQKQANKSDSLTNQAKTYYLKALKMTKELGDNFNTALHLGNISRIFLSEKKYKEAEENLQKALALSKEINSLTLVKDHELAFSDLYEQVNQPLKALEHYKRYVLLKDSVYNEENTKKTVRSEMNFEFEKQQAVAQAEQEKQNAITLKEKQRQKLILIFVSCFLLLVAVFAAFMYNRWRITQKQKAIIEKQKEKIVDSINYAQFIQESILIDETEIQKHIPDSFIYFQPKDIVSGDFYWFSKIVGSQESEVGRQTDTNSGLPTSDSQPQKSELLIIAAVDCTGHGVPGAFMSMIGNTLLNQIVNEKRITTPSEILYHLNLGIYDAMHQKKGNHMSRDGMDIALCCIDYQNKQLQYAGAQNPLYLVNNNELNIVTSTKQSIGSGLTLKPANPLDAKFANHTIPIEKGMSIYIFSDGYKDQFGGGGKHKFGTQKFKDLILNNQHLEMPKQKELFASAKINWQGQTPQTDDILVIGIKF